MEGEVEPMNEQFNNVAEMGPEGDATDSNKVDVEIREVLRRFFLNVLF